MVPWMKLAEALAPDGTVLTLWQRGTELVIRAGTADLMMSRMHASEEALAEIGCEGLGAGARVLIGGLGMGFTLRTALALLPATASVVVAELVPEIVDWVRGPIGGADVLADPRVTIDARDVRLVLRDAAPAARRFDAILLDVDNGPGALTQAANRGLYGQRGLALAARALRPGGRYALWSAQDDSSFEKRLAAAGFEPRTVRVRAHRAGAGGPWRGQRQAIFVGDLAR